MSNPWYQVDYCYDATGLLLFQSASYQGNGWGTAKQCSGRGTAYSYDALGRKTSSTNPDGTVIYQYLGRAVRSQILMECKRSPNTICLEGFPVSVRYLPTRQCSSQVHQPRVEWICFNAVFLRHNEVGLFYVLGEQFVCLHKLSHIYGVSRAP
jgi:YD repeat-containing protein